MFRAECERVRAKCENVDGAEERFWIAGADAGIDVDKGGEDFRSRRARRYMARSSYEWLGYGEDRSSVEVFSAESGSAV